MGLTAMAGCNVVTSLCLALCCSQPTPRGGLWFAGCIFSKPWLCTAPAPEAHPDRAVSSGKSRALACGCWELAGGTAGPAPSAAVLGAGGSARSTSLASWGRQQLGSIHSSPGLCWPGSTPRARQQCCEIAAACTPLGGTCTALRSQKCKTRASAHGVQGCPLALDSLGLPQCCPTVGQFLRWPGCGWAGEPTVRMGPSKETCRAGPVSPALFTVSGTFVSQARSMCKAGHVFSFSPDNDSGWPWAASRCAQLCPRHSPVPSTAGTAGPGLCTWPLGHLGHVPSPRQLAMGHVSHPAFACASLGTASPGLACPPGLGPAGLKHLSWPQGCPCCCPCCVALPCPLGSARWGALHPIGK